LGLAEGYAVPESLVKKKKNDFGGQLEAACGKGKRETTGQ